MLARFCLITFAAFIAPAVLAAQDRAPLPPPSYADVKYGPYERNVLDFWRGEGEGPRPLIVFIHGGGFVAGDKSHIPLLFSLARTDGFALASINYRFVGNGTTFPAPQHDGARAIQFLRSKAVEWNIDPKRIAAFGGSAGAGISLWIGFHDDRADPNSADPVSRQSTRIQAVGSIGGQTTYDPIKIKELVGGRAWEHPSMFKVYGTTAADAALNPAPALRKLYDEVSAITHLTRDDPPVFMIYSEPDEDLPSDAAPGQGIHHPRFARLLWEKMDRLAIPWAYRHVRDDKPGNPPRQMLDFFRKHLGPAAGK